MEDKKIEAPQEQQNKEVDVNKNFLFEQVNEEKRKAMLERIEKEWKPGKVHYPEYWAKRKSRLNKDLVKKLEETASRKPVACDDYGFYTPGFHLHRCFIVTTTYENETWSLHVYGEQPISLQVVKEVRMKFLPDDCVLAQLWGSRSEMEVLKGVVLYEIPSEIIRK